MATFSFKELITVNVLECANCGIQFGITADFEKRRIEDHNVFYCPNGHSNIYQHQTEAEKLRIELKRKEQELANVVYDKRRLENNLVDEINERKKVEKKLKRVHNGVCPCCNRSFTNLEQHMKTKHPEIAPVTHKKLPK